MAVYDFLKDFAGPFATVVASGAALVVTWRFSASQAKIAEAQKDIALDKLNFDVFGKRYEIYLATRMLIDRIKKKDHASLHPEEVRGLYLKMAEACFFFDKPMQAYINEVRTTSDRILLTRDQRELVDERLDEATWVTLGKTLSGDEASLSEMYRELLPAFERAMALTQLVKERALG
jgi:hypothetical protein